MTSGRGSTASVRRYVRSEVFPTPFCAGCGHGILLGSIRAIIDELGWSMEGMLFVSGIGCGGWIPNLSDPIWAA